MKIQQDSTFVNQIYDDAKDAINQLGAALKVGAEEVWRILVVQQLVYSISMILCLIIISFALYKSIPLCCKWIVNTSEDFEDDKHAFAWLVTILISLSGLIFIIIFLANLNLIVGGIINPEYGALKEIMNLIK